MLCKLLWGEFASLVGILDQGPVAAMQEVREISSLTSGYGHFSRLEIVGEIDIYLA